MSKSVLLVEDDPVDSMFVQRALEETESPISLEIARDGADAWEKLQSGVKPQVIILDLNMPRMSGLELLIKIKNDPDLRTTPAIVLSTTDSEDEVRNCLGEHANAFLVKPDSVDGYRRIARRLTDFWLNEARLIA